MDFEGYVKSRIRGTNKAEPVGLSSVGSDRFENWGRFTIKTGAFNVKKLVGLPLRRKRPEKQGAFICRVGCVLHCSVNVENFGFLRVGAILKNTEPGRRYLKIYAGRPGLSGVLST